MGSLRWALSWLIVVVVGLAPMLVYWVAGLIGRAFWSKRGVGGRVAGRPEMRGRSQRNGPTQLGRGEGGSAQCNSDPVTG
jgi:hypothetical protein